MAGSFYVHRALKYVIHQHNRSIDNNNNDNNNDNHNNNDNDNNDNNNGNNKMEPKTIKDICFYLYFGTFQVVSFTIVKSLSTMAIPLVCLDLLLAD